jgi:creatinine amidohydrolase/Fe(II)-dependent formamide hydrolase-like protein
MADLICPGHLHLEGKGEVMESRVGKMTWDEVNDRAKTIGVAIIPAGTTERHGGHLPMETDAAIAFEVAHRVGNRSGAPVFPALNYGIIETQAFQGVFLSGGTYASLVKEVCLGVESLGFKKILFISGHHQNNPYIFNVLKQLFEEKPKERILCMVHCMALLGQLMPDFIKGRHIGHADFRETSLMLAIDDKRVYPDRASQPEKIAKKFAGSLQSTGVHFVGLDEGRIGLCHDMDDLTSGGGYGQFEGASREGGEKILNTLADYLSRVVEELKKIPLALNW